VSLLFCARCWPLYICARQSQRLLYSVLSSSIFWCSSYHRRSAQRDPVNYNLIKL